MRYNPASNDGRDQETQFSSQAHNNKAHPQESLAENRSPDGSTGGALCPQLQPGWFGSRAGSASSLSRSCYPSPGKLEVTGHELAPQSPQLLLV